MVLHKISHKYLAEISLFYLMDICKILQFLFFLQNLYFFYLIFNGIFLNNFYKFFFFTQMTARYELETNANEQTIERSRPKRRRRILGQSQIKTFRGRAATHTSERGRGQRAARGG